MGADPEPGAGPRLAAAPPRRRTALVAAAALAVVLGGLVWILATRDPAQNRRADSPLVGRVAPQIEGITIDGSTFDLDDARGQWVVVNFFATWCVPCRTEHPQLVEFASRHAVSGDAGVVSVAFDDQPDEVAGFFADQGGDWPVLVEGTGPTALDYGVSGVPESYLVAPSGVVATKIIGGVTADGIDRIIADIERQATEGDAG